MNKINIETGMTWSFIANFKETLYKYSKTEDDWPVVW